MDQTTISAVIIDDEPDAISLLEMYLRHFPFIQVIGKESDAKKGLELVKGNMPELVFLDIDMPDMNGLTVADKIQSNNFHSEIVFTTAHQHYAYDALGIEPLYFLTKPFSINDLENVIQRYNDKEEKKKYEKRLDTFLHSQDNPLKIKLPSAKGVLFVDIKEIVIIRSNLTNCDILLSDGTEENILLRIQRLLNTIKSPSFFPINRSTIVNLNYLQRFDKKNKKCILKYNQTLHEEKVSRIAVIHFEKTLQFPFKSVDK